jgi:hypothetical protein
MVAELARAEWQMANDARERREGRGGWVGMGRKLFALWRFRGNWVRFVKRGGGGSFGKNADGPTNDVGTPVRATGVRTQGFEAVEFI